MSGYNWKGLKLKVDENNFYFGTLYKIECEVVDLEELNGFLEDFLRKKVQLNEPG
ncbi:hypothetical protein E2542_SST03279 [Spatholobus suberectus]|nr:hypothetical protein E2542_SST03279 [Spatholobus suberectus]